jgi:hypothetical protein
MALAATDNRMGGLCAGINKTRHRRRRGRYLSRQGAARGQRSVSVHANGDKLVGRTGNDTLGGIRTTPTYSGTTGAGDRILPGVEGLAWTPSISSC